MPDGNLSFFWTGVNQILYPTPKFNNQPIVTPTSNPLPILLPYRHREPASHHRQQPQSGEMLGRTTVEVGADGVAVVTINNPPLNLLSVDGIFLLCFTFSSPSILNCRNKLNSTAGDEQKSPIRSTYVGLGTPEQQD